MLLHRSRWIAREAGARGNGRIERAKAPSPPRAEWESKSSRTTFLIFLRRVCHLGDFLPDHSLSVDICAECEPRPPDGHPKDRRDEARVGARRGRSLAPVFALGQWLIWAAHHRGAGPPARRPITGLMCTFPRTRARDISRNG